MLIPKPCDTLISSSFQEHNDMGIFYHRLQMLLLRS